jgi:hypothetical protein
MNCTFFKLIFSLSFFLFINAGTVSGQIDNAKGRKAHFSIEIDPATFVFNGYSAHLRFQPQNADHLLIGLGIYAMDMPDLFVDFNSANKDQGWDVRLDQGYGLFGEYFFDEVNQRWFVGAQLSAQVFRIEQTSAVGHESFTNGLLMGYGGYSFKPFAFDLYIKPWAGVGYTTKLSGTNRLGDAEYDIAPITMFATLHLGYMF